MRRSVCSSCGRDAPINDTIVVDEDVMCLECANEQLSQADPDTLESKQIVRQADPTICALCGTDHGDDELGMLAALPVCPACEQRCRHWKFPVWLKAASVTVLLLAGLCFAHNYRYLKAHIEVLQGNKLVDEGNMARGQQLIEQAARRVPDFKPLAAMSDLYAGMLLLSEGKSAEALARLQACRWAYGNVEGFDLFLLSAEAGVAFDQKDYEQFLSLQRQMMGRAPEEPIAVAGVASGLACMFAITGDDAYRQEAMEYLERADKMAAAGDAPVLIEAVADYRMRILHRLSTRQIISPDEFFRRFPDGWEPLHADTQETQDKEAAP